MTLRGRFFGRDEYMQMVFQALQKIRGIRYFYLLSMGSHLKKAMKLFLCTAIPELSFMYVAVSC
jgi:hypothetical protein